jgi:BirA family biotin operon repressor/biotin-[acetyl-CoA-carboxylase] ligase
MEVPLDKKWIDRNMISRMRENKILGFRQHYFKSATSTNEIARDLAKKGEEEGTLVIAQIQNKGHGRMNRMWYSPLGGLWFSLILRPKLEPYKAPTITLLAGVAAVKTLIEKYDLNATIKWPNDILIKEKKVCGILTEMRTSITNINYVILGMGFNANFRLEYYYKLLLEDKSAEILNQWRKYSDTLGRKVRISTLQGTTLGTAIEVDENGALIIRTKDNEVQKFLAGDCVHLSSEGGTS